jgi:hypothetical protein
VFKGSGKYEPFRSNNRRPYSMTNIGLLVHLPLLHRSIDVDFFGDNPEVLALLNCKSKMSKHLAIHVEKHEDQYIRVQSDKLVEDDTIQGEIMGSPQELLSKPWDLPRFNHPHQSDRILEVFFSGDQGIRPVRVIYHKTDKTTTEEFTVSVNTAGYRIGVFELWGPCAFLFMHDPTHQPFVVVAGKDDGGLWLDLALDFKMDKLDLKVILESYRRDGDKHADVPQKNLDRILEFLTDDVAILAEAQHVQNKFGNRLIINHTVNICTVDKDHPAIPGTLPIRTCTYVFSIFFSSVINAGFSMLETYPGNDWEACGSNKMNFFLNDSSESDESLLGTICFQHELNRNRFALTLGFRNKTLWSDLIKTGYHETAKDICTSYCSYFPLRPAGSDTFSTCLSWEDSTSVNVQWNVIRKSHTSNHYYESEIKSELVSSIH